MHLAKKQLTIPDARGCKNSEAYTFLSEQLQLMIHIFLLTFTKIPQIEIIKVKT
jgi:hypothetical protein